MTEIAVLGAGYVGLVSAACFADLGHHVSCLDIDDERLSVLAQGECPIHEPQLPELLEAARESGRLVFGRVSDPHIERADVVVLCLPTPTSTHGGADTSAVEAAVNDLRHRVHDGAIIVTKSTVPVGMGDRLRDLLDRSDVAVVSNPEFLREGSAVADFMAPDRIVIGCEQPEAGHAIAALYDGLDAPIVMTDRRSSELIKYAANAFLGTKISFVNDIAELCEAVGADIDDVVAGIGSDPRIGREFLRPGPGFGGSCFPKDMRALAHLAEQHGQRAEVVEAATSANHHHVRRVANRVIAALDGGAARTVALLGLAFKAGTDDTRESPAVHIASQILDAGATVVAHDPHAVAPSELATRRGFSQAPTTEAALAQADAVVVATEWAEYAQISTEQLAAMTPARVVVDSRGVWSADELASAGFDVWAVGRSAPAVDPRD